MGQNQVPPGQPGQEMLPVVEHFEKFTWLRFSKRDSHRPAVVFLPGFPAIRSRRNEDIAQYLSGFLNATVYVLHYQGLGQNRRGPFSFQSSMQEAGSALRELTEFHSGISLVGHSWGGAVALTQLSSYHSKLKKLVLMSPLVHFGTRGDIDRFMSSLLAEHGSLFGEVERNKILEEIYAVADGFDLGNRLQKHPLKTEQVTILQAKTDDETPPDKAREVLPLFPNPPRYLELDQDHSFLTNRDEIMRAVRVELYGEGR